MTKFTKLTFLTLLAFSTYACNGSNSSDSSDTSTSGTNESTETTGTDESTQTQNAKTPSKIDFEIPAAIKTEIIQSNRQAKKVRDNKQSGAFKLLKEKISETDTFSNDIKIQFVLIDAVISDIQDQCNSVEIENECTIPANQISFNVDESVVEKLVEINEKKGNEFSEIYGGSSYLFSEIAYTEFAETDDFQFRIKTTDTNGTLFTLKWSKDLSLMNALYSNDTSAYEEEKSNYSHTYEVKDKVETITLINKNDIYDFELILSKLNDDMDTFTLTSSYDYVAPTAIDGYTKTTYVGEIDNTEGSLESSEYIDDYLFNRSVEYFDTQGRVESSIFCDDAHSYECSYDDQSTWIEYTYAVAYVDNIPLDIVNTEFDNGVELPLDASFYLFPPSTALEDLTLDNLEELSIGRFSVGFPGDYGNGYEQLIEGGVLHDLEYLERLDEVEIYVMNPMAETLIHKIDRTNIVITVAE